MKGHKYHYDELVETMTNKYGSRLGTFLAKRFARAIRRTNDLCIDNLRVAKVDSIPEMERYKDAQSKGCCTLYDSKLTFKSDDAPTQHYWIGFNYGH